MPAITDRDVVRALRPFVRATGPLLDTLRTADFARLRDRSAEKESGTGAETGTATDRRAVDRLWDQLARMKVPGTGAWAAMDVPARDAWWLNRVGRLVSLLAALPGVGGALADRLPIQAALGTAGQGLVLSALAGEHGYTSVEDRVRLLAFVLFQRTVDGRAVDDRADEDRATAELTADLTSDSAADLSAGRGANSGRPSTLRSIGRTVWKLAKVLWALEDELDKRPQGRFYHQALGMVPVVGVVGDYFGERSAMKRVRRAAYDWFAAQPPPDPAAPDPAAESTADPATADANPADPAAPDPAAPDPAADPRADPDA